MMPTTAMTVTSPPSSRALAVARGDEVGERGDAVDLADADDLAQTNHHSTAISVGPEVDRQEADAVGGGAAHAAVEGPGRGIDRERQRVDVRVGDDRAALVGALVAVDRRWRTAGRGRRTTRVTITQPCSTGCLLARGVRAQGGAPRSRRPSPITQAQASEDVDVEQRDAEHARRGVEERQHRIVEQHPAQEEAMAISRCWSIPGFASAPHAWRPASA